jgi:ureidoglycolate lyase
MPTTINPPPSPVVVEAQPLVQLAFAEFGTVICNPEPSLVPQPGLTTVPQGAIVANQGSALKYPNITAISNYYGAPPSQADGRPAMSMFVCGPRVLQPNDEGNSNGKSKSKSKSKSKRKSKNQSDGIEGHFDVRILERHPFTSQTFIPLGLSGASGADTRYLVIVAPSLDADKSFSRLPFPVNGKDVLQKSGPPDLTRLRAFVASGTQAVTYAAGTWHAPMVVIGQKPVSFVVVQNVGDINEEDCQEVTWSKSQGQSSLRVAVPCRVKQVSKL